MVIHTTIKQIMGRGGGRYNYDNYGDGNEDDDDKGSGHDNDDNDGR